MMILDGVKVFGVILETECPQCEGKARGAIITSASGGKCRQCKGRGTVMRPTSVEAFRKLILCWVQEAFGQAPDQAPNDDSN